MPKIRPLTVRFPPRIHQLVREEADAEGVSVAQFIREAAIMRAVWAKTRRGEVAPAAEDLERALRQLRE